ncbi:MAG: 2-dehydropantoate 2-reductase [Bacteroidota bacterium]
MKILIYGIGGIGGYFGGRIALTDHEVTFIARGKHLEAILDKGLQVKSINGDFVVSNAKVVDSVEGLPAQDLILICVKAWQVKEVAPTLNNVIKDNTVVLPLQNGISAPEYLRASIPDKHILGGLCRIFSKVQEAGVIEHSGYEPSVTFGELNGTLSNRVKEIDMIFKNAGFVSELTQEILVEMWKKYLFINATSSVGSVTRVPFGVMRTNEYSKKLLINVLNEMFEVSKKLQIGLPKDITKRIMSFIDTLPEDATASMQRDIMNGLPSELEDQTGAIIRLGKQNQVPTSTNQFIYDALKPMEDLARNS